MCSVLFLDIVGYSKKAVSAQISSKEAFNAMLANAISKVPVNDRVILDTGDGAAVTFLGDVEDALKAVLAFRESLLSEGAKMEPPIEVCMGINLGPVRLVKDINGRPNIVGDGINVAQRIMGFAAPGQILVSRSYFDAASRLSQEYAGMFYSEGVRADKHDREHEIYAIGKPSEDALARQRAGEDTLGIAIVSQDNIAQSPQGGASGAFATFQNASGQQRALYVGIAVTALALLIVVTMKIVRRPEAPPPQVAVEAQSAPAETTVSDVIAAPPPEEVAVAPETKQATREAAPAPKGGEAASKKQKAVQAAAAPVGQAKESKAAAGSPAPKEASAAKPAATATLSIAVTPWGEVFLDGKSQGVSPPLDVLHVTPGEHAVEIRNTTFPPYTLSIQVKADEQMKIKHKFNN